MSTDRFLDVGHIKADLRHRTVKGGAITVSVQAAKFGIQLGTTAVLARLLAPEDFGLVGMVAVITGFVVLFRDLGLSQATVQRAELRQDEVSALFWINVGVSVALALVTAAIAPLVAWFYGEPRTAGITAVLAVGFVLGGIAVQHQALLDRQMRFGVRSAVDLGSLIAGAIAGLASAALGAGYWSLVIMTLTTGFALAVGLWIACGWRPGRPVWTPGVRSMLGFGGHLTGFQIINYIARNIDNVLIGRVWGARPLGLYSRAYQLLMLPSRQINAPVAAVAMPALARLHDQPERYRAAYLRLLEKVALLTMPAAALMVATSDWIVRVVLGPGWEGAAAIFTWLGIAAAFQPLSNTTGWLFVSQARTGEMFRWGIIGGSTAVVAIVAGLPWGPVGVAAAYATTDVVLRTPLLFWMVGRRGPVSSADLYRAMILPGIAAGLSLLLVLGLRATGIVHDPWLGLFAAIALTAAVTIGVLLVSSQGRAALRDFRELSAVLTPRLRG